MSAKKEATEHENRPKDLMTRLESFFIYSLCGISLATGFAQGNSAYQYPVIEKENIVDTQLACVCNECFDGT